MTSEEIFKILSQIKYPGFSRDIVSFGLIKGVEIKEKTIHISIAYTTEPPEKRSQIEQLIRESIRPIFSNTIQFNMIENPVRPAADRATLEQKPVPGVKTIIAVASGKGGVGKSTVAVNLACALQIIGKKVGLLDCDIYGPSIPMMMGIQERPALTPTNRLIPHFKHGVHMMSLGFFMEGDNPVIWRGPMVTGAIRQLLYDTEWKDLDVLIVDLPPGTGDAQLSLVQLVPLRGAVIVTTPQDVALIDAKKGVVMFQKLNVEILGMIENMSYFVCPHCQEKTDIFREGGGHREAERMKVPFLGKIPLEAAVRAGGDEGVPIVVRDTSSVITKAFLEAAKVVSQKIDF